MSDDLSPAVAALQRKLDEQLQTVSETKKLINMLLKTMGKPPQYSDVGESSGIIRKDQFYGKPLATVAQEYLEMRKQACPAEEIMRGLEEGGFDFAATGWKPKDYLRMLAISLAKNNVKFHKLPNNTFGLLAWYDQAVIAKRGKEERGKQDIPEDSSEEAAEQASAE
jgi:hypothetical protein